ncbi:glycerophosphodiester phosphodiesterase [Halalkalicoccus subterraneus]|uniref:glycerophosphodiester phosphodiesterase n=1 Tax=Halalkalicoccus subterraneus TaxID=2675002 RepID=UPI000EFBF3E2|nr:glycerophosphodiester phosphodiesterase [Halalkalicoccus subterraneus]
MATGQGVEPMWVSERAFEPSDPPNVPSLIAHRGFAGEHPENTAAAIRAAARVADWIEIDCRPTADGAIAVYHDHRLDRCTPLTGPVSTIRSEKLFSTPARGGGTVLSLPDALSLIPAEVGVVLDLKGRFGTAPTGGSERWEWIDRVVSLVERAPNPVLAASFWEDALAAVDGRLPTAYLFEHDVETALAVAQRHGCRAIHPPADLIEGTPFARGSTELLDPTSECGLAVNVWTVTNRHEAAALAAAGVDGLISDYADVLSPRKTLSP